MTTDINGLRKAVTKQLDLRLDQYNGIAKEGDLIIDCNPGPTLNQAFIGTANGGLVPLGGGGGNSTYSNANVANYLPVYSGNIGAGNIAVTGTVGADAIVANSITVDGDILPAANVAYDLGSPTQRFNSIYLSNNTIFLGNNELSVNGLGNLTVDGLPVAYTSNAGDITVTSVDTQGLYVSGNALIVGDLTVSGNTFFIDTTTLRVTDPVIQLGGGANGDPLTVNDGKDRGMQLHVYDTDVLSEVDKFMGWKNSQDEFVFGSNVTNLNDLITINEYGNARADTFIGNIELPNGGTITEGGGLTGSAITLTPAGGSAPTQALLIYPTVVGDGDHVHLTAGGGSTELYLGDDFQYVKLADTGNVEVKADDGSGSSAAWAFDTTGGITFPDGTRQITAYIDPSEPPYRGFYAGLNRFYGTDPSVNQIIIANTTSIPTYTNLSADTNDDAFQASGLDTASIVVMLNLYGASSSAGLDPVALKAVAELFIDNVLYDGATPVTDANTAKARFYSNWSTIFAPVSGQLYNNFRYYIPSSFSSVTATGGTGTDFIPQLFNGSTTYVPNGWNNTGTGYTVGDILTVTGDQYSGTTPTNDATFTVTAVGPSGEVQDYTVSGQPVNNWPSDNISDGGSDQYDTGNYIQTSESVGDIPYNGGDVETSGLYWGGSSEYVVVYQDSTWSMMAFNTVVLTTRYAGEMGADSDGTKEVQNLIGGSGGGVSIGNFVFSDNEMTATDDDVYIYAADDLYLDARGDDIHLRGEDDVRVYVGYDFTSDSYEGQWTFRTGSPSYLNWPDGTAQFTAWTGSVPVANVSGIGNIATVNLDGNVANVLAGDGTWIAAGGGGGGSLPLANGTSNINIAAADGNVTITSNATRTWTFGTDGSLTLPSNNTTIGNALGADLIVTNNTAVGIISTGSNGLTLVQWVDDITSATKKAAIQFNTTLRSSTSGDIAITTGPIPSPKIWNFDANGNMVLPGNTFSINYANGQQASAPLVDVLDTNGLSTVYYPTFVENRANGQIVRADVDLSYRTDTNTLTVGNVNANVNGFAIGYRDQPQVVASNATLALSDAGKHYWSNTAGNLTLTIPTNANTAFTIGTTISIVVQAAGNVLVNAASGVNLYMAGNSTSANRVVGTYGVATLLKVGTNTWFINGTSVT